MIKLSRVISRSTLAAIAILNVSLTTTANAETIRVARGPNGATHVVKVNNIPVKAQQQPVVEARPFPTLVQRGSSGAFHIVNQPKATTQTTATQHSGKLITRGPNGAAKITSR